MSEKIEIGNIKTQKVLLAAAGTAGHVNPALAVASELVKLGVEPLFLGADGIEKDLVKQAGYKFFEISKVAIERSPLKLLLNLTVPFRLQSQIKKVEEIIKNNQIDLILGFGGYISGPAYVAASKLGIPVVIHEQNSKVGIANKKGSAYSDLFLTSFPETSTDGIKSPNIEYVGLPMRPVGQKAVDTRELMFPKSKNESKNDVDNFPNVLIFGGSLGAQKINETIVSSSSDLLSVANVIHVTGKGKSDKAILKKNELPFDKEKRYQVVEYTDEIPELIRDADLIICRAGAGTCHEIALASKPAIFVPLPIGNGEQSLNTKLIPESIVCNNNEFTPEYVVNIIIPLLNDDKKLQHMSEVAGKNSKKDAAKVVAKIINQKLALKYFQSIDKAHFMAISGVGIAPIAKCFEDLNLESKKEKILVSGCDSSTGGHSPSHIIDANGKPTKDLLVYSSAIKRGNSELETAIALAADDKIKVLHRSSALDLLLRLHDVSIAVAGSHGKTTITSMISSILDVTNRDNSSFVIGASAKINGVKTNGGKIAKGEKKYIVAEADESDGSFQKYHPNIAIISNVEPDHLDHYGDYEHVLSAFENFAADSDWVVLTEEAQSKMKLKGDRVVVVDSKYLDFTLNVPGEYNRINAALALKVADLLHLDKKLSQKALQDFSGADRRFEVHKFGSGRGVVRVVDDYAHHPTEVKNLIDAALEVYKDSTIVLVFQPHLYSRTVDFAKDFAKQLARVDLPVVTKIYPAREVQEDFPEVTPKTIAQYSDKIVAIDDLDKAVDFSIIQGKKLAKKLKKGGKQHLVILSVGAGGTLIPKYSDILDRKNSN
ncbi:MAG: glycosyltransferase [Candidatus Ancillula sp.]|nr:glycosyltransferase [Candidatus Ancillula sp.]